jgi:hypothetical protein
MFSRNLVSSKRFINSLVVSKRFASGGNNGPQIPEFHDKLGQFVLVTGFVWIMYRARENKGQLFGLYEPWLHEHHHVHHHYVKGGDDGDSMPTLVEHDEDDDDEEE